MKTANDNYLRGRLLPLLIAAFAFGMNPAAFADWQAVQPHNSSGHFYDVEHVPSDGVFWLVGSGGRVFKSTGTNGFNRATQSNDLYDVYFSTADPSGKTGWTVGANGTILNTTDGWTFNPQTIQTTKTITSIDFVPGSTSIGWVVAHGPSSELFYTTNGGATWSKLGESPGLLAVDVTTADHRCFVGLNGTIATIDFGLYKNQNSGTTNHLYAVEFGPNNANVGIAVGANGTILRTGDRGVTWTRINSGTHHDLFSIDVNPNYPNIVLVGGAGGTILKSVDSGENWFLTPSPTSNAIRGLSHRRPTGPGDSTTIAHAVGDNLGLLSTDSWGGSYPGISITNGGTPYVEVIDYFDFGATQVGSTSDQTFTIKNTGTVNLVVGSHGISGSPQFTMPGRLAPVGTSTTLTPGESSTVTVRYAPSAQGIVGGTTFGFSSNAPGDWASYDVELGGTGTAGPAITVSQNGIFIPDEGPFGFGEQAMGSGRATVFTITNVGQGTLSNLALSKHGASASEFSFSNPSSTSLGPNQSTTFSVTLTPSSLGAKTAEIRIESNISNLPGNPNPFNLFLSGTGVNAPAAPILGGKRSYRTKRKKITVRGTASDINSDIRTVTLRNGRRAGRVSWTRIGLSNNYSWRSRVRLRKKRSRITVQATDRAGLKSTPLRIRAKRKGL